MHGVVDTGRSRCESCGQEWLDSSYVDSSWRGDNNCMELLIQAGADVKVVDKNGWTALMWTALERR